MGNLPPQIWQETRLYFSLITQGLRKLISRIKFDCTVVRISGTDRHVSVNMLQFLVFFSFLRWGEAQSTWYVGQYLVFCTSPGLMMSVGKSVEWAVSETEVIGEYLPQCRFVHHKSDVT
jgi:hypothetical protein